jgi:TfoX/Sxy family transcriptional regulator of competence genes
VAFDEGLAERVRGLLGSDPRLSERKMFGGLCFMTGGNMCCGVMGDLLIVRVGPDAYAEALGEPHARPMDFTGRAMKGVVYVDPEGLAEDEDLDRWLERGLDYAGSLPPK